LLIVVAFAVIWLDTDGRRRPLDSDEVRVIRGVADRVRREQAQPFEW